MSSIRRRQVMATFSVLDSELQDQILFVDPLGRWRDTGHSEGLKKLDCVAETWRHANGFPAGRGRHLI